MKFFTKRWETKFHKKATSERQHSGNKKDCKCYFPYFDTLLLCCFLPLPSLHPVAQEEIRKMQVYHQGNSKHRILTPFSCMFNMSSNKALCTCPCTRTELVIFCLNCIILQISINKHIHSFHEKQVLWSSAANICSF